MTDELQPVLSEVDHAPNLFLFWCPGCKYAHHIDTTRWQFDGDMIKPTVTPSFLLKPGKAGELPRCHLFVRNGRIQYLRDSTHVLAGMTIDMVPVDQW